MYALNSNCAIKYYIPTQTRQYRYLIGMSHKKIRRKNRFIEHSTTDNIMSSHEYYELVLFLSKRDSNCIYFVILTVRYMSMYRIFKFNNKQSYIVVNAQYITHFLQRLMISIMWLFFILKEHNKKKKLSSSLFYLIHTVFFMTLL